MGIDEREIKNFSISLLRKHIEIVRQIYIFLRNMIENMMCGNPDASFEDVLKATKSRCT